MSPAYEAVTFQADVWKAVVQGVLQRPDFNSKGAALAFAKAVAEQKRRPEPVRTSRSSTASWAG